MKILLADDNPEVRSALRLLLEQEVMPDVVTEAANAKELFEQLNVNHPSIILLDWELPGLHACDCLAMVRSCCPEMKIIALSSKFEARQEALAAGVDAFTAKVEPPEQFLSTLRSFLSNPK